MPDILLYHSPLGQIVLSAEGEALTSLFFAEEISRHSAKKKASPVLSLAVLWLDLYFSGTEPDFTPPLMLKTTPFRRIVAELVRAIPYGRTSSYKLIAERVAKMTGRTHMSAQAVGGALAHNPIALIIPCHRVVGSDGSLTGYAGGLARKSFLLALEAKNLFLATEDPS